MSKRKVLLALSGGVDSSVAGSILMKEGYECIGSTMLLHTNDINSEEVRGAKNVANSLDIPFLIFDFTSEFKNYVVEKFVNSYLDGFTPNPCVDCNKHLKFGLLYEKAKEIGCDYVATGHYAKIVKNNGRYYLKEADNKKKDQSYFLYNISEEILSKTLFPLGEMDKEEVRELAKLSHLPTADKNESQDICFVPDGDYTKVIEKKAYNKINCGDFIGPNGEILGKHKGIIHYTIGQRKGLGISYKEPLFVKEISAQDNKIYLGTKDDIFKVNIYVDEINWINGEPSEAVFDTNVRTRYHQELKKCTVHILGKNKALIIFKEKQKAITPGQSAVFYNDEKIVLGGGIIC